MKDTIYFKQARLLLRALPLVTQEAVFALKGGTAINFFIRDLPRLSVDIDLAYLPVSERAIALADVQEALLRIADPFPLDKNLSVIHPKVGPVELDCFLPLFVPPYFPSPRS